jgi:DNA-binding Lrp family transcriptional regulator
MAKLRSNRNVDQTDIMLIKELEIDARQTNWELANKLGISSATVGRRLERLHDERTIRISTIADSFALGYGTQAVIGINVHSGQVDAVANELASCEYVQSVGILTGPYDIIAWTVFQNLDALSNFIGTIVGNIFGIVSTEIMMTLKLIKASFGLFTSDKIITTNRAINPCSTIDVLDLNLIREMQMDSRQTTKDLAEKLGISRPTARKRLHRLIDDNLIRIVTITDPCILEYRMRGALLIKVHPGKIESVAEVLAKHDRISHLVLTAGRYEIVAWSIFRDQGDMSSFVRNELSNIPGIISHETAISLRIAKASFILPTSSEPYSQNQF